MAKILDAGLGEEALGQLGVKLILSQNGEDSVQMLDMFLQGLTENQNVIEESNDKLTIRACEDGVHDTRECWWSVGDSKWHNSKLKVPMMRFKCCFLFITLSHADLMVARAQIDFEEEHGAS